MAAIQPPANFAATPASDGQSIELTWSSVPTYTQFEIEKNGEHFGYTGALSFTDFDVVPEEQFQYRIRTFGTGVASTGQVSSVPQVFESDFSQTVIASLQNFATPLAQETDSALGPIVVIKGSTSGIQVPLPTGGSDTSMIQNIIDNAPDGSVINFQPNVTYIVPTTGISVGGAADQSGITLDGHGCTLYNNAAQVFDVNGNGTIKRNVIKVGGAGASPTSAIDCTVKDFTVFNDQGGGSTWGYGLIIRGKSHGILVQNIFAKSGQGDGLYIANTGTDGDDTKVPHDILVQDSVFGDPTSQNWRRHCCSIVAAYDITIERCTFDKTGGGSGGTLVDIEPLGGDTAHHITFNDCDFGWYSPNSARRSVQCNGTGVWNVTLENSRSSGSILGMVINTSSDPTPFHDFLFADNVSDPNFPTSAQTGALVRAEAVTFGVTVVRNRANIGPGAPGFFSQDGNVTQVTVP